ncbi:uncharacterized protein LOC105695972 [Orussus abietinus]|uniref:uncharacterized protein LOC105695972 n=1 Tax=Orussus abietinus TaxID=222816 RepID=UPI00062545F0|nr:uncharacterized protein LOC105695972 [Orussus abietinus]
MAYLVGSLRALTSLPGSNLRALSNAACELTRDLAYVNGEWVGASSGATFPVSNPFDLSTVGHAPDMSPSDAETAIDAAACAFERHRGATARERAEWLRAWHAQLRAQATPLAEILGAEGGKSVAEAQAEVAYGNSFVEWFAEEARRSNAGEVVPAPTRGRQLLTVRQPVGVAALITPWNFPHAMVARKAAAALAAGCSCVVKPSADAPLTALAMAVLAERAGLPAGLLNVVTAGPEGSVAIGETLCASPRVRALSFTGSTAVGKILYRQCASTVKKIALELGGDAPFVVFESADPQAAVNGALVSKFRNNGQTCVAANRFYVQEKLYGNFVEELVQRSKSEITPGPLIKESQLIGVEGLVNDAVKKGAKLHCGGSRLPEVGPLVYAPTILTDVDPSMEIYTKEIFGPVAVIHRFQNEEEALQLANSTTLGLAGYFYSRDLAQVFRVARRLEVGMVGVNEGLISCAEAAFGGVKESGIGREGSTHGLEDYQDIKYICIGGLTE